MMSSMFNVDIPFFIKIIQSVIICKRVVTSRRTFKKEK